MAPRQGVLPGVWEKHAAQPWQTIPRHGPSTDADTQTDTYAITAQHAAPSIDSTQLGCGMRFVPNITL